jgi:hypothetical protein
VQDKKTAPRQRGPKNILTGILNDLRSMHSGKSGEIVQACVMPGELNPSGFAPLSTKEAISEDQVREYYPKKVYMQDMQCAQNKAGELNSEYTGFYLDDKVGRNFRQMTLYRKWVLSKLISSCGPFGTMLASCFGELTKKNYGNDNLYLESMIVDGLIERRHGTFYQASQKTTIKLTKEPTMYTLLITNFVCDYTSASQVERFISNGPKDNYHPQVEKLHNVIEALQIEAVPYFMNNEKTSFAADATLIEQCLIEPQSCLMIHLFNYLKFDPCNHFPKPQKAPKKTVANDEKPPPKKKQKTGPDPIHDNFVHKNLKNRMGYLIGREILDMVEFGGKVVKPTGFINSLFPCFNEKLREQTLKLVMPISNNWTIVAELIGRFIFFSGCWKLDATTHATWGKKHKPGEKGKVTEKDWRNNVSDENVKSGFSSQKTELLFAPTTLMDNFPKIDLLEESLTISQIFQLVVCGKMYKHPEDDEPFFDVTNFIETNGNRMKHIMNTNFQKGLDWNQPGNNKADPSVSEDSHPHLRSLANELMKSSKKYLGNGTLKTKQAMNSSQLEVPEKVNNIPTTVVERNQLSTRLLEMSELFSSMQKWASLNYAILKNKDAQGDYKLEHFGSFPLDDRSSLLSDVTTHQVRKDILTMKDLVKVMQGCEELNNLKIDGVLPVGKILECAKDPKEKLDLGSGEKGMDYAKVECVLFQNAGLKPMTMEEFKVKLGKNE